MADKKKMKKQIVELQKKLQAENEKDYISIGKTMVEELGIEDAVSFKKFVKKHKPSLIKAYEVDLENERKAKEQKQHEVASETQEHTDNGMSA